MSQTAMERAREMMKLPVQDLPPLAVHYAQYLGQQYGLSGDVLVLAYAHYAQEMEGLACDEVLYQTGIHDALWFTLHRG